jgi:hypothetical protein
VPIRDGGDIEFGVRVTADNQVFINGVRAATDETKKLGDAVRGAGDAAGAAGKSHEDLAGAVFKGTSAMELLKKGLEKGIELYQEMKEHTDAAQQSQARMEAVLHATGGAAGQTSETIGQLADEMSRLTRFDDSQIKDAATTLLTFDKIAGDTFTRVIKLSADLASTGRGDLQTWVTVLGKVGQNPGEAIGLFERAFGKLDPALKVAIQNASDFNDKQRAMNLLLAEGESRAGGTAQESYRGLARQIQGTAKAWDELLRTMGNEVFSAKSKDASIFEVALNKLSHDVTLFADGLRTLGDAAKNVPDWVLVAMGLGGVVPLRHMPGADAQQTGIGGEVQRLQRAIAAGKSYDGDTSELEQQLRVARMRQAAAKPAGADPWASEPGFAPALSQDSLTIRQRQALRDQDTQQQEAYWDHVFSLRQNDVQRSLQIEQQRHASLLESDSDYFAHVAQLEQQQVTDRIAQLQGDLAYEKQLLASAGAEVDRAQTAFRGGTGTNEAVAAAESKLIDIRQKIKSITADLVDTEQRWGDAETKRAASQYQADMAQIDRLTAIGRAEEDTRISLETRLKGLTTERDLVGQTDEQMRQGNEALALATEYDAKRLDLVRQIADLEKDPSKVMDLVTVREELLRLPGLFKDAMESSRDVIAQIFSRKRSADMFSGIVTGLSDVGKAGWDAVVNHTGSAAKAMRDVLKRDFFDWLYAQFAKPFVLNVIASLAGGMGMTGIAQAATSGAGGNTIGTGLMNWLGSSALGSYFSGAGQSFMAGYQGSALLAGGSTTDQLMNTFGQYVAQFGGYIMAATGIIAGVVDLVQPL